VGVSVFGTIVDSKQKATRYSACNSCLTHCILGWFSERIENILSSGAPSEFDWWEDESDIDSEAPSVPPPSAEGSSSAASPYQRKRFRNVGFETWQQVQHNWRHSGGSRCPGPVDSDAVKARSPAPASKRELIKGLSNNRQYEMKHRVALEDLVAIYNEMWTEEWSE
jgi:hypothetical protein